jgi:hypothetical protein
VAKDMCTAGINTADFKLVIHQQAELVKLVAKSVRQWADLAKAAGQNELGQEIEKVATKAADLLELLQNTGNKIDHLTRYEEITVTKPPHD